MSQHAEPSAAHVTQIAQDLFGSAPRRCRRFANVGSHNVFDVAFDDGRKVVVRFGRDATSLRGAVQWSQILRPRGIPLPEILHAEFTGALPFLVLERLRGTDLGNVYHRLDAPTKRALAHRLAALQADVADLPRGAGFGETTGPADPLPHRSWRGVVEALLDRSSARIAGAGRMHLKHVERVAAAAEAFHAYFRDVSPTPFLHDITTKNVILWRGRMSGIIDVDTLCYGDPMFLLGLIHMALLAHGRDPDYLGYWCEAVAPSTAQQAILPFYTALHCVDFMGEIGQRFNRRRAPRFDPAYAARLEDILAAQLALLPRH